MPIAEVRLVLFVFALLALARGGGAAYRAGSLQLWVMGAAFVFTLIFVVASVFDVWPSMFEHLLGASREP